MSVLPATCVYCGGAVDPASRSTYRLVRGFVRRREQGGPNHIRLIENLAGYACSPCVDLRAQQGKGVAQ